MASILTLHDLSSPHLPAPVPYAVLAPDREEPLLLCLLLLGAGGTRDALVDLQASFDTYWSDGSVPPMIIVAPSPGLDYYLEDPGGSIRWESFLADDLVPHLRSTCHLSDAAVVAGISGGGYGALKLAFARPRLFAGVAAMQPMLGPGLSEPAVGARNRIHHAAGGPPQLIGPGRDPVLWESNNPANIARANATQIREAGLAIYIDAADRDFLNAHDGAEFLHRVLWDLDLSHEYHLIRDADHGGPSMRPRLRAMLAWFGTLWISMPTDAGLEQSAAAWLESGMKGKPPKGATSTVAFLQFLRASLEPRRAAAAKEDPSTNRRYGPVGQ